MEFIIDFFRNIDGWVYYIVLVVNTILIFAIIGYLGEKNNEQILKLGASTSTPNLKGGAMNLTPVHNSPSHNEAFIPKVEATQIVNNQQNNSKEVIPVANNVQVNNAQVVPSQIPVSQVAPNNAIPGINQEVKPIIKPEDNAVDPNEKAPAVLIINSSDMNKDAK